MISMSHDWPASDQRCKDVGMHLITLEDDLENAWLNDYLKHTGLDSSTAEVGIWIGYKGKFAHLE